MKPTTLVLAGVLLAPLASPAQTPVAVHSELPRQAAHAEGSLLRVDGQHRRHHRFRGIERFDRDDDGRISRAEFDSKMAHRTQQPHRVGSGVHHAPEFAAIDRNHDGYIVASEVRAYHERMRPRREAHRQARFDERFALSDLNHDGKLGRVEVSGKMPRLERHFAWLDENRDGFLSRAELQAARHDRR